MATELQGNVKLQRFISLLADLNHEVVEMIQTGNTQILLKMNDTIEEMYSIQHGNAEEAYTAIDEDMQIIYKNFDGITVMLQSSESARPDKAATAAIKKFLLNIFDANVRIIHAYGLA